MVAVKDRTREERLIKKKKKFSFYLSFMNVGNVRNFYIVHVHLKGKWINLHSVICL